MRAQIAQELHDQIGHWGEHPVHTLAHWRAEIAENKTRMGYWEWVAARILLAAGQGALSLETATPEDADRLLGLGDQFLEDLAEDAVQKGSPDPDYEARNQEWETLRPLFVVAPAMLQGLKLIAEIGRRPDPSACVLCAQLAQIILETIDHDE